MSNPITVHFCCRDRFGNLTGVCVGVEMYEEDEEGLEALSVRLSPPATRPPPFEWLASQIRFSGRLYDAQQTQEHVGNILWDAAEMTRAEARLLLCALSLQGWQAEEWCEELSLGEMWARLSGDAARQAQAQAEDLRGQVDDLQGALGVRDQLIQDALDHIEAGGSRSGVRRRLEARPEPAELRGRLEVLAAQVEELQEQCGYRGEALASMEADAEQKLHRLSDALYLVLFESRGREVQIPATLEEQLGSVLGHALLFQGKLHRQREARAWEELRGDLDREAPRLHREVAGDRLAYRLGEVELASAFPAGSHVGILQLLDYTTGLLPDERGRHLTVQRVHTPHSQPQHPVTVQVSARLTPNPGERLAGVLYQFVGEPTVYATDAQGWGLAFREVPPVDLRPTMPLTVQAPSVERGNLSPIPPASGGLEKACGCD